MKLQDRIKELKERKQGVTEIINELDKKLKENQLSETEYASFLEKYYGAKTKQEVLNEIDKEINHLQKEIREQNKTKTQLGIIGLILGILLLINIFTQTPTTPTGYTINTNTNTTQTKNITKNITINQTITKNTNITINHTNITSIKISGKITGTATIKLKTNNTEYLLANITSTTQTKQTNNNTNQTTNQNYTLTTNKKEYALGETVHIQIKPETQNKSLYITHKNTTKKIENNTYTTTQPGEHKITALITLPNNILRLETNITTTNQTTNTTTNTTQNKTTKETTNQTTNKTTNKNINQTKIYEFSDLCTQTCQIPPTNQPTLTIQPEPNTTLTITTITITTTTTTTKQNQPPKQTQKIPNITLKPNQTKTLNLNQYFTDPDQDTIIYDTPQNPNINTTIKKQTLTIHPQKPGTHTTYIYATDGTHLTTSNTFTITITQTNTTNQTNNNTNQTTTPTNNNTNTTTNPCKNPNINQRPSYCFSGIENKVFQEIIAPIEDLKGRKVGRFTRFGNMVIKGLVVQNTTASPEPEDFKIGYTETRDYEERLVPTAWIDTSTGNLHLKGQLYEEQDIIEPPQHHTYVVRNKNGIVLGYFDELRGDLYLKGNLVQLGKV